MENVFSEWRRGSGEREDKNKYDISYFTSYQMDIT